MAIDEETGWCFECEHRVLVRRRGVNHLLHLALTVLTAGIWVIVWILTALVHEPWRCSVCGTKNVRKGERRIAGVQRALAASRETSMTPADRYAAELNDLTAELPSGHAWRLRVALSFLGGMAVVVAVLVVVAAH